MKAEELVSRLEKCRQTRPGRWVACCPAHVDKTPSLAVSELPDGTLLIHCFADCTPVDILAAIGLDLGDLFPEPMKDRTGPVRGAFNAADVLECLRFEAHVAYMIAREACDGTQLSQLARDRLRLAVSRIETGRDLANGER